MSFRRFFSVFFAFVLALSLSAPAFAAQDKVGDWEVEAKAALLVDPETDEILYARNIHEKLYPASLTKVMTALLVLEAIEDGKFAMDTVLTASESAVADIPNDASSAGIVAGEELTVEQLLHCILVVSANEACNILAESVSGTVDAFVERMNERARELGCADTNFVTTNGLHSVDHYTTAWDMYLITREAMTHEVFLRICNTKICEVPATNMRKETRRYSTTNHLISTARQRHYLYDGASGVKTGYTSAAGSCLIATAGRSGRSLLTVVLGGNRISRGDGVVDDWGFYETIKLFDYGFDGFKRAVILESSKLIDEVEVTLSQEQNTVKYHPERSVECLIPSDITPEDIERTIVLYSESVEAPVTKGQVLGEIILSYNGTVYATVNLLADEDVSDSRLLRFQKDALEFAGSDEFKFYAVCAGGALVLLIVICSLIKKGGRRRYDSNRRGSYRGRRR